MAKNTEKISHFSGRKIAETLQQEIVKNAMPVGVRLPTGAEIARRFLVSQKTADRALRALARKGIVERISGKGTFVKHNRPKIMRPKIAVFFGDFKDGTVDLKQSAFGYFQDMLLQSLADAGYAPDIFNINIDNFRKQKLPAIDFRKYELILSTIHDEEWRKILQEKSTAPIIFSNDDKPGHGKLHQAYYDYVPGFIAALSVAQKAGWKKFIIFDRYLENGENEMRTDAFFTAVDKLKIPRENIIVRHNESKIIRSLILFGVKAAQYVIDNSLNDYMIFTTSDFIAYGMVEEFALRNKKLGKDYYLISYDNTEIRNDRLVLGLTAITHPLEGMVKAIMQMLEDLIRCPETGEFYRSYQVPANEVVFRESFPFKKMNYSIKI